MCVCEGECGFELKRTQSAFRPETLLISYRGKTVAWVDLRWKINDILQPILMKCDHLRNVLRLLIRFFCHLISFVLIFPWFFIFGIYFHYVFHFLCATRNRNIGDIWCLNLLYVFSIPTQVSRICVALWLQGHVLSSFSIFFNTYSLKLFAVYCYLWSIMCVCVLSVSFES